MKNNLFATANFSDEIYRSMEKQLIDNQLEKQHGFKRLAQATDLLNKAAEIFEQAGMSETAEDITELLQNLAGALK